MTQLLHQNELGIVESALKSFRILSITVCRLYSVLNQKYVCKHLGAICLVKDHQQTFFKLVDVNTGSILWELDLNRDIKYEVERPFFHSFLGANSMNAFSFADESEASQFYERYQQRDSVSMPFQPKSVVKEDRPSVTERDSTSSKKEKKKERDGFFGFSKRNSTSKKKIDKNMISGPSDFQHLSHVGYNPKTGFSAQNIPPEWKAIFAKAGITEDQLKDKKTAKFIHKFMQENTGKVSNTSLASPNKRAPPPPPPSKSARAPPPPPPSRRPQPAPPIVSNEPVSAPPVPPALPVRSNPPPVPSYNDRSAFYDRPVPTPPKRQETSVPPPPPSIADVPPAPPPPSNNNRAAPPPPAPSNIGAPPPPPIPSSSTATTIPKPPVAGDRGDLLASIRSAGGIAALKKSDKPVASPPPAAPVESSDDLAGALKSALMMRQQALAHSDSESEESEWDD